MGTASSLVLTPAMTIDDTFESFFRRTYARLAQASLLLTGSREEAQDVAQEALARAYSRWERVRTMDSPEGYVYRTALNIVRKGAGRSTPRTEQPSAGHSAQDPSIDIAERDRVMQALKSLPGGQREVLVMTEWLDLDTREVARALRIAESSVRVRLHRARSNLREALGGNHE
ncbi:MAG: sigma-70 family RNA polymerase sigma factor [Actinomycetota bacterium]